MCITPVTLHRQYSSIEGNKTDIVPCGKCPNCLKRRVNDWTFRLRQEMKVSSTSVMLTLTYENEPKSFNGHGTLCKKDLQLFWKRLRKQCPKNHKIKYYCSGEYGATSLRPHYHAIVFNMPTSLLSNPERLAQTIWKNGHIHIGECNSATIRYTLKYITQEKFTPLQDDDDRQPNFSTMSKNLGKNYLTQQMVDYHINGLVGIATNPGNQIIVLPRYYKDKIFSKLEKKQLAEEAKKIHNIDWNEFIKYDFDHEVQFKKEQIRKFERKKLLNNGKI